MVLIARELPEVPLVASLRGPLEVTGVGARDREVTEIDRAAVLVREDRRREAAPVCRRVGRVQGLLRVRVDAR